MKSLTNFENMPEPALLTGAIDYPLMNDYMFRSVMQSSEKVLKGLLCALLRLNPEDARAVQILNPIELKMQVNNQYNWPDRSLVYLSRLFDGLNAGESYRAVKPSYQIGILNIENYQKYSDKFTPHVLDLTPVHLAKKEDKEHELGRWARLFYASTWEDFRMISADNKYMEEAGNSLYNANFPRI